MEGLGVKGRKGEEFPEIRGLKRWRANGGPVKEPKGKCAVGLTQAKKQAVTRCTYKSMRGGRNDRRG